MGVLIEMYDKLVSGTLSEEERKALHKVVISQHQKDDTPTGLYAPNSCPCNFGICNECVNSAVSS